MEDLSFSERLIKFKSNNIKRNEDYLQKCTFKPNIGRPPKIQRTKKN
jgi:hypothetical protein